jgi:hypothetical protein
VSDDTLYLEDEDIPIQEHEDWRSEEKDSQRSRRCRPSVVVVVHSSPNLTKEWKKAKLKTEDLLTLVNNGFLREKEMDMWRAATGDPYQMEKNPDEIPMFARFVERGLALPASDVFQGHAQVLWY